MLLTNADDIAARRTCEHVFPADTPYIINTGGAVAIRIEHTRYSIVLLKLCQILHVLFLMRQPLF